MTLNDFFKIIKKYGKLPDSMQKIAEDLFEKSDVAVSKDTIKAWLKYSDGPNSARSSRFPHYSEPIVETGFIQYFEKHTRSTWQEIQKAFDEIDHYSLIDCNTENAEIFYRSLLALFYELLRSFPVSLKHILPERPLVIGRENELSRISEIYETYQPFSKSNYLLLTGIGGIGKSSLASAYAHRLNESGMWTIQQIICEDSDTLCKAILKLQFDGLTEEKKTTNDDERENFNYKIDALKKLSRPALIILDNFNQPLTGANQNDWDKLLEAGTHVRFLITSRKYGYQYTNCEQHIMHISPLENNSLLALYKYYRFEDSSDHEKYLDEQKDVLEQILALVENHTLIVMLLAKLSEVSSLSERKIYELLTTGMHLPSDTISFTKDSILINNTLKEILKKIFDISLLTDTEKSIMKYMSMIPLEGITIALFKKLTGYSQSQWLNLKKGHWIIVDEETFILRLHPLICDTILSFDETKPSQELCQNFSEKVCECRNNTAKYNSEWHTCNKIIACIISKIYFSFIRDNILFLKDEYKESILFIEKLVLEYSNSKYNEQNRENTEDPAD